VAKAATTKVYTGTHDEREAAITRDAAEAARLGWEPVRREEMHDSVRITYRIIGSDMQIGQRA